MSIISKLESMPKTVKGLIAMLSAAVIIPSVVMAWGPVRPTYTIEAPADHVTFNSITNNPNYGDERNFVTIKDAANQNAGGWVDDISVTNGKEYYVRMYVHNNAAANLNLVANNVIANFNVPTYEAKRIQIDGYLSASNSQPTKIWDQAVFSGSNDFSIAYVPGSATYTNNKFPAGLAVEDSIVGSGVKLGYDKYENGKFDGNIPGCFQYTGLLIFKVKAVVSDFSIQKTVRINGSTDKTFKESVSVKAGDKVDYQIYFKNTGGTQLKDVVIKDTLPANVEYINGTSKLFNSNGLKTIADGITKGGAIIGGYMPNGDAYLMFTAQVASSDKLACGVNTLTNIAKATTSNGSKEDTAVVTVNKTCEEPKVAYTCNALTVTNLSKTSNRFSVGYSLTNALFKDVSYVIRDVNGKEVETKTSVTNSIDYNQTKVGKYSVQATVKAIVNGKDVTATSDGCKANFEVSDTIVIPPVTPVEQLPHTGPAEDFAAILGVGSLVTTLGYYLASRRGLIVK